MPAEYHNYAYLGPTEGVTRIRRDGQKIVVGYEFWPASGADRSLLNIRWADGPDGKPVKLTPAEEVEVEMAVLRRHVESPRERAERERANAEMDAEQAHDDRGVA